MLEKTKALRLIKQNIQRFGFHIYIVGLDSTPRYAYTIGLRDSIGSELVLAGAIYYDGDEAMDILHAIRNSLARKRSFDAIRRIPRLGSFTLRKIHGSWSRILLLGALDYYKSTKIDAYQIVPDKAHWTNDTPDLARSWSPTTEPVWQWLQEPWPYSVAYDSTAATNLDALRGARITEAIRWEEDYWEMFAGPRSAVSKRSGRIVPLGTLLALDSSLVPVLDLAIGQGLRRDDREGSEWSSSRNHG